jgi:transketolase
MASGSEVDLALQSAEAMERQGVKTRVVSFPSWEIFEMQSETYKESVLLKSIKARVSIEAGVSQGWDKYIGLDGVSIAIDGKYGSSAPQNIVFEKYGFNVKNILEKVRKILK